MSAGYLLIPLVVGYVLGSIPFGLLLTRAAGLGDVRNIGSGNIGATNVLRTGNKKLAALTLLLDGLKGTLAVLLGTWLAAWLNAKVHPDAAAVTLGANASKSEIASLVRDQLTAQKFGLVAGLGAFFGHIFPVWLGFKGGKGAATYIGVLAGIAWPAALVFAVTWLATAFATRFSSLAALLATLASFLYLVATGGPFVAPAASIMGAILYWKHRENIRRLVAGTESRIGAKG